MTSTGKLLLRTVVVLVVLLSIWMTECDGYRMPHNRLTTGTTQRNPHLSTITLNMGCSPCSCSPPSLSRGPRISPLVDGIQLSKTIEINTLALDMEREGRKVHSLCIGEPDYAPPSEVIEATGEAARKGHTRYTGVSGDADLRTAIANDLSTRKGLHYQPNQIVLSNGAKQAFMQALMTVITPGDEVLLPSPYWTSYPDMVRIAQGVVVPMTTLPEHNYQISPSTLRHYLLTHPKITAIILCNPSNPTGVVYSKETLQEMAIVLKDFPQITVISDEIYERIVYDNTTHTSFASLSCDSNKEQSLSMRCITVNGFSKSLAMTGYRLGYTASSLPIAQAISKLQSQLSSCASSISQYAAFYALTKMPVTNAHWMDDRITELKEKRDLAWSLLQAIPKVKLPVSKPQGAFYLFPDVSEYYGKSRHSSTLNIGDSMSSSVMINNSIDLCRELLKSEGIAMVPGSAFGDDNCLRLSYATSLETIRESIEGLHRFLISLQ